MSLSAPGSCLPEPANAEAGSACHVRPSSDVQPAGLLIPSFMLPTATSRPDPAATATIVPAGCATAAGSHVRPSDEIHTAATSPPSSVIPDVPTAISRAPVETTSLTR